MNTMPRTGSLVPIGHGREVDKISRPSLHPVEHGCMGTSRNATCHSKRLASLGIPGTYMLPRDHPLAKTSEPPNQLRTP